MELFSKQYGQGEPLVILHGLMGSLDNWQTLAKKFAEKYTVFTIDLRNHGRSPHNETMNYSIMANDLAEFMDKEWIYNANIIGHSMGGKIAMKLAFDFPDLIQKLAVVDISPKEYTGNHQLLFDAMLSLDLDNLRNRKEADLLLKSKIPNDSIRLFLLKNLARKKTSGYNWKLNLNAIVNNYQNILQAIDGDTPSDIETLFIKGGRSNYIEMDDPLIKKYFPNSKIEIIENSGHWVHAEKPDILTNLIFDFFE